MGSNAIPCSLGLANIPLVAGVHHLPAGLPLECSLKYLVLVISTQRHEQLCLLRAASANVILASFCLVVSIGTTFAVRCCNPFILKWRVMVFALFFRPTAC